MPSKSLKEREDAGSGRGRGWVKPSAYAAVFPYCSISNNYQTEEAAQRVMQILADDEDTWRRVEWEEYKSASLVEYPHHRC